MTPLLSLKKVLFVLIALISLSIISSHCKDSESRTVLIGKIKQEPLTENTIKKFANAKPNGTISVKLRFSGQYLERKGAIADFALNVTGMLDPKTLQFMELGLFMNGPSLVLFPSNVKGGTVDIDTKTIVSWLLILDPAITAENASEVSLQKILTANIDFFLLPELQYKDFYNSIVDIENSRTAQTDAAKLIYLTYINNSVLDSLKVAKEYNVDLSSYYDKMWNKSCSDPLLAPLRRVLIQEYIAPQLQQGALVLAKTISNPLNAPFLRDELSAELYLMMERLDAKEINETLVNDLMQTHNSLLIRQLLGIFRKNKIFSFNETIISLLNADDVKIQYGAYCLIAESLKRTGANVQTGVHLAEFQKEPDKYLSTVRRSIGSGTQK